MSDEIKEAYKSISEPKTESDKFKVTVICPEFTEPVLYENEDLEKTIEFLVGHIRERPECTYKFEKVSA